MRQLVSLCLVCVFALASATGAQTVNTGELRGTVTDPSGGVIVEASVVLDNGAGQTWNVATDRKVGTPSAALLPGPTP